MPDEFRDCRLEPVMDNLSGEIRERVASAVKNEALFSCYAAWDFHGLVWWDDTIGYWCVEVWQFHSYQQTFLHETLDGLMQEVKDEYGIR